jgi:hypothetical protein
MKQIKLHTAGKVDRGREVLFGFLILGHPGYQAIHFAFTPARTFSCRLMIADRAEKLLPCL